MNFSKIIENKKVTFVLSVMLAIVILLLILFPIAANITTVAEAKDNETPINETLGQDDFSQNGTQVSSFPFDISLDPSTSDNQEHQTSSVPVKIITPKPKATATNAPTSTPKAIHSPTPSPIPTEIFMSTLAQRDLERTKFANILSNKISEYSFTYNLLPKLYSNKSNLLLTEKDSSVIYFYNDNENKTNALSLNILDYKFHQVLTCENSYSVNDQINFVYKSDSISLCKEDGAQAQFPILQLN